MSGKNKKLPVNYSVANIVACILQDNRKVKGLSRAKKERLYNACRKKLEHLPKLADIVSISRIKRCGIDGAENFVRLGVLPPELVIIDQRFKDLCALPFWTVYNDKKGNIYRRFDKCPGHGFFPCCPPNSRPVEDVQQVMDRSSLFIVLQTRLIDMRWQNDWRFTVLHRLARDIRKALGPDSVTGIYGAGPCGACAKQPCRWGNPCKTPALRTSALESMGICVDQLCRDMADLSGNKSWRLTWLKHYGLPQQHPKKWKFVEAISVTV